MGLHKNKAHIAHTLSLNLVTALSLGCTTVAEVIA